MADPQPSPDYQSRTGLAILTGLLTLLSVYVATDDTTPPQPAPKPSSWYVVQNGEVVKAPEIIAVAEKLKPGTYEVTGFPDEGKITRFSVVVSGGFQPAPDPVPPKPEPPKPPEPQPPQPKPDTIEGRIAIAASVIPAGERDAIAKHYADVAELIRDKKIQSTRLAHTTLIGRIKETPHTTVSWQPIWEIIGQFEVDTLEDMRQLMERVSVGLRGVK